MPGKYTPHHPPLVTNPAKTNWVEQRGGLPAAVDAVARALVAKGYTRSHAIAIAVNHVKKVCASGRAFGGRVAVSPEARAKACAAVTRWEAMKASTLSAAPSPIRDVADWEAVASGAGRVGPADRRLVAQHLRRRARELGMSSAAVELAWTAEKSIARYERDEAAEAARRKRKENGKGKKKKGKGKGGKWDEAKHPRRARGASDGGRFDRKGPGKGGGETPGTGAPAAKGAGRVTVATDTTATKRATPTGKGTVMQGKLVAAAQARLVTELAKVPAKDRPANVERIRRVLARSRHGGRLGPAKRRLLRRLARDLEPGPARRLVAATLRLDAPPR